MLLFEPTRGRGGLSSVKLPRTFTSKSTEKRANRKSNEKSLAAVVAMVLPLGYDMTQQLFGGIVTSLGGKRAGQAIGLNVLVLFVGFGLGSVIFGKFA